MNDVQGKQPIQGKVAKIVSERELAINIGSSKGVKQNMKFKVLSDEPMKLFDPETHEEIGVIDREKVRVVATEVYEKFAICKTYRKRFSPGITLPSYSISISREILETLKVDDSSLPEPLPEEQSYVKIGDRVLELDNDDS